MSVVRRADISPAKAPRLLLSVTAKAALGVVVGHIDHLCRDGWDVHVLVGEAADNRLLPRATLHVVPMARGPQWRADLSSYRALCRTIQQVRPDVVVAATPKAAALTLRAARRAGVPHRVWWAWGFRHETDGNPVGRLVELDAGRCATHIVAASDSLARVLQLRGLDARVIGAGSIAGIDTDTFEPAPTAGSDTASTRPTAVFIGRLSKAKGIDHLARIWPRVLARMPAARLVIAGEQDPLDPAGCDVAALTHMPGVELLGFVDDTPNLLRSADVLVHPSRREGLPAVVLEAGACEVPAVVWDVTGSRDAVADDHTGTIVQYGDEVAFAEAVSALLEHPSARQAMGQSARLFVAGQFGRQQVEKAFADFLGRIAFGDAPSEIVLTDHPGDRAPAPLH